ncbi:hypothetical protein N7474_007218 [Penicillium riverlandense]|uniref:uncharacterized protein n=1 Tax=Penicillium riverlandense TaxID=1903569 RepID=UPI00254708EE|nr:uncharacterized protein N7474_007218 [Penicillium riverlandense]KAJ5815441.1 hypothetical protein N7474_007218 [Penicillium riverlandense]
MPLPPEQINIKRRREEEPVETLYIQSALHQTKRRFTDFVFHRVLLDDGGNQSPGGPASAAQRALRSPRSVSSLKFPSRSATAKQSTSASGVPLVRATSPGAEFREAQRMAAARKESADKHKRAVHSPAPPTPPAAPETPPAARESTSTSIATPSSSRAHSLRRFQISRSSSANLGSLRSLGGGIQKRRADGPAPGVAVLVEQLRREPHSRQASMVAQLAVQAQIDGSRTSSLLHENGIEGAEPPVRPRKRPVVNQAEKKWREERKGAISAAKQHLSDTLEKSALAHNTNWDDESERLARELEQVALEIEKEDQGMDIEASNAESPLTTYVTPAPGPKPPLKYQPRPPKQPRTTLATSQTPAESNEKGMDNAPEQLEADDSDGDYVYDVYIRRPIGESEMLKNPLAEFESDQQQKSVDSTHGIGVIVITSEDEQYWEHFVEDDEEEWDSEDADSNAENNPANDYPDEEISSDEDDPTSMFGTYRRNSSDDDFNFDDSASESGRPKFGHGRFDGYADSDHDSW